MQIQVLGDAVGGAAESQRGLRRRTQRDAQRTRHLRRDVGLDQNRIARRPVIALRPFLDPVLSADQLRADANRGGRAAHAAREDIGDAEFGCGGLGVEILDRVRRCAADHFHPDPGQSVAQLLGDSIREIGLARVARQIGEGHHRDPVRRNRRAWLQEHPAADPGNRQRTDAPGHHRPPRQARCGDSGRPASRRVAGQMRVDRVDQRREARRGALALPADKIDRLDFAEAERRLDHIDLDRDVASGGLRRARLVAHEAAFGPDRARAPRDDDAARGVEMLLDFLAPVGAAADMRVPPNVKAFGLKRGDQRLQSRPVLRFVRDEYFVHRHASPERETLTHVLRHAASRR